MLIVFEIGENTMKFLEKKVSVFGPALIVASLYLTPAAADTVEELKGQIEELRQAIDDLQAAQVAEQNVRVEGAGAPRFSGDGFENFKVRGRIQADFGAVEGQSRFNDPGLGTTSEVRRVRIGAQGEFDDFFYVVEVDFADNNVSVEDAFLVWDADPLDVIIGHHKPWVSLEEQSDDLLVPFMERAAFTNAFQFGYDLGISVAKVGDDYSLRAGILHAGDLSGDDEAEGFIPSARVTYSPEIGDTTRLHLAASARHREDPTSNGMVQYSRRPQVHTTDTRFVDTGSIGVDADTFYGAEIGMFSGPFYATAEWGALHVNTTTPGVDSADFGGGYVGAGYVLTGETIPYDPGSGTIGRVSPASPVHKDGFGALVANARFDYIDLTDAGAGINGGEQSAFMAGLTWIPHEHVRFLLNYSLVHVNGGPFGAIANPGNPADDNFSANVVGFRTQVDW
jgi:phosphate-selective porin OprO/OprP